MPDGKRPFEEFEPVLRALESLDPSSGTPRYFSRIRFEANEAEENADSRKWLSIADGLDDSGKLLIGYCLASAAEVASDKSRQWISLAEAAGVGDGVDLPVIRVIIEGHDQLKADGLDDARRTEIEDRVKRLEGFKKMAAALASDLRKQLKRAGASKYAKKASWILGS